MLILAVGLLLSAAHAANVLNRIRQGIRGQPSALAKQSVPDTDRLQLQADLREISSKIEQAFYAMKPDEPNKRYANGQFGCILSHPRQKVKGTAGRSRFIELNQQICTDQSLPHALTYENWLNMARHLKQLTQALPQSPDVLLVYTDIHGEQKSLKLDSPPYPRVWPHFNYQLEIEMNQGNNKVRFVIPAANVDWTQYTLSMIADVLEHNLHSDGNLGVVAQAALDCHDVEIPGINHPQLVCILPNTVKSYSVSEIDRFAQFAREYAQRYDQYLTVSFFHSGQQNINQNSVWYQDNQQHIETLNQWAELPHVRIYMRVHFSQQQHIYFLFEPVHH